MRRSFKLRALHNAWVHQKEVEKARKMIKSGEYEEYVKRVLKRSKLFSKALKVADRYRKR